MAELVVMNGIAAGTIFVLGEVPAVVGRSPEAHLRIGDPWISSMHAMFERRADALWVVDLESRNGVFVADERVAEAEVPDGAVVRLGRTEVRFTAGRARTDEVPRAAEDAPRPAPRRETMRSDPRAAFTARNAIVHRAPPDAHALARRPGTVLRMALDEAGLEGAPDSGERLRGALDAAAGAALEQGAVVARLAGVGVLAIFGLAGASPEDAARALTAARAARRAIRDAGGLELRAGLESGPLLAGKAAGAGAELAALGPAAERAERLAALARPGEILAGPVAAAATGLVRVGLRRIGDLELEVFEDPEP